MDIRITDIFDINIKTDKYNREYIVLDINSDHIDDYLTALNQYNGTYIYKLNKSEKLKHKLSQVNINIDDYIELGHYMIYESTNVKILLVNKTNTRSTNKYNLIDTIGELYIWKPVSIYPNYTNLGVITTSNPHEVPEEYIGLVPMQHIKIFTNPYSDLFQNDYSLLGCSKDNKKKLLTINILNENVDDSPSENELIFNDDWTIYVSKNFVLTDSENPWFKHHKKIILYDDIDNSKYFEKQKYNKPKRHINKIKNSTYDNTENSKYYLNNMVIIVLCVTILLIYIYFRRYNLTKQSKYNIII